MRYIGNKTKLLGAIEDELSRRGVGPPGLFFDVFAGTATVARHFKGLGWRCVTNDLMRASYAVQMATVVANGYPSFAGLTGLAEVRATGTHEAVRRAFEGLRVLAPSPEAGPLCRVLAYLEAGLEPGAEAGLIARCFSPGGAAGRMYFREEHARRLDAILDRLAAWKRERTVTRAEFYVLLAATIDGADRVANISGTYGAYLKTWQANTAGPFRLVPPPVIPGRGRNRAYRCDGNHLVRLVPCDVLYIDPPYNHRDYAANYHVLEVIAERHAIRDPRAYEANLAGVTGMRPYRRSAYCRQRGGACAAAFRDLVAHARARHVIVSYNEEGILSREEIEGALAAYAGAGGSVELTRVPYKRFRSDADGRIARNGAAPRTYRVLAGRGRDELHEWLFHARRGAGRPGARAGQGRSSPGHVSPDHASPDHVSAGHVSAGHALPDHVSPGPMSPEHASPHHASPGHVPPDPASPGHVSVVTVGAESFSRETPCA